jgi:Uma2 family endonuclease
MRDPSRLTVEEFFAWQEHVEGRYELVDGHIVPHPDYVTLEGLAAPSNRHAAIVFKIGNLLASQLPATCRVYAGPGAVVDRMNANVPDLAISCDPADFDRLTGLANPAYIFEVLSPSTARIDRGRKVAEYLAIASLEAYVVLDAERRSITVYRRDEGPQTYVGPLEADAASAAVALSPTLALPFEVFS